MDTGGSLAHTFARAVGLEKQVRKANSRRPAFQSSERPKICAATILRRFGAPCVVQATARSASPISPHTRSTSSMVTPSVRANAPLVSARQTASTTRCRSSKAQKGQPHGAQRASAAQQSCLPQAQSARASASRETSRSCSESHALTRATAPPTILRLCKHGGVCSLKFWSARRAFSCAVSAAGVPGAEERLRWRVLGRRRLGCAEHGQLRTAWGGWSIAHGLGWAVRAAVRATVRATVRVAVRLVKDLKGGSVFT